MLEARRYRAAADTSGAVAGEEGVRFREARCRPACVKRSLSRRTAHRIPISAANGRSVAADAAGDQLAPHRRARITVGSAGHLRGLLRRGASASMRR